MSGDWVALLRGVNVGGHNKLPMADLRSIVESCGFERVRTYIQSGNVVFSSRGVDDTDIARRLSAGIAESTGLEIWVTARSRAELSAVVHANPFIGRGEDPSKVHVIFLEVPGDPREVADVDAGRYAPDEVALLGREAYVLAPNGIGKSKLPSLAPRMGLGGTMRNWRTVVTLCDMVAGDR